jgi:hypothetical protein
MANSAFTLSSNIGSDGKSNRATKYQLSHGFSAGSVIRFVQDTDGKTGAFLLAQATSGISAEAVGIVESVDAVGNEFTVVYNGEINTANFVTNGDEGVTGHDVWFLDATVSGGLTSQAPTSAGQVVKPVLTLISGSQDDRGLVTNYQGTIIGGDNTVSLDSVHPVGEIIAFAGSTSDIPTGWQLCNGSTLGVGGDYATYFSRIGTKYGYHYETVIIDQNDTVVAGYTAAQQIGGSIYEGDVVSFDASAGTTGTVVIDAMAFTGGISGGESSAGGYQYPHGVTFDTSAITISKAGGGQTAYTQYDSGSYSTVKYVKTPDLRARNIIGATSDGIAGYMSLATGLDGFTQGAFGGAEDADVTESSDSGSNLHVYTAQSATNANLRPPFLAEHYIIRTTSTAKAALVDAVNVSLAIDGLTDVTATGQADGDFLVRTGDTTPVYKPIKLFNNYPSDPGNFENVFQIHTDTNRLAIGHNSPENEIHIKSAASPEIKIQDTGTNGATLRLWATANSGAVGTHEQGSDLYIGAGSGPWGIVDYANLDLTEFRRASLGVSGDLGVTGGISAAANIGAEGQIYSNLNVVTDEATWIPDCDTGNVQYWHSSSVTNLEIQNTSNQKQGGMYTLVLQNTGNDAVTLNFSGSWYAFANGIKPNIIRPNSTMVISMVTATGKLLCTWAEEYS